MSVHSLSFNRVRPTTGRSALILATLCVGLTATTAQAQPVYLSDLLGAPSGTSTCVPNPPFTEIPNCSPYGFGVNCPGSFASSRIRFSDTMPFDHGIGMHPASSGTSIVRFDLDAVRDMFHREPLMFAARVGIDIPSGGGANGALFTVVSDGSVVVTQSIANANAGSVPLSVSTEATRFLNLETSRIGDFNANHAAYADAQVILGPPCPVPALVAGSPIAAATCPSGSAVFSVNARYWGPFVFQWLREVSPNSGTFVALVDGPTGSWDGGGPEGDPRIGAIITGATTDSITIAANSAAGRKLAQTHAIRYRCVVTNMCGDAFSVPTRLAVSCDADTNCDGFLNSQDFFDFLAAFFSLLPAADYNHDSFINSQDFFDYLGAFFSGC